MSAPWLYTKGPATVDTSSRTQQRWNNTVASSPVKLNNYQFLLPAFQYDLIMTCPVNCTLAQYNFSVPSAFTIVNYLDVIRQLPIVDNINGKIVTFILCIAYRTGNVKVRYQFNTIQGQSIIAPQYTGQLIKPNFSLEVHGIQQAFGDVFTCVNFNDLTFITSLLFSPIPQINLLNATIQPSNIALGFMNGQNNDLFVTMPILNPQPMLPNGPFLDNN